MSRPRPTIYALTVNSMNPSNGVAIAATPADNGSLTGGNTTFTLNYAAGTTVKLTAPASAGSNNFSAWDGMHQRRGKRLHRCDECSGDRLGQLPLLR